MAEIKRSAGGTKRVIVTCLSLLFMYVFPAVMKPTAGITQVGMSCIGIFIGVIIAAIAIDDYAWAGVLGMFALILFGFYDSGTTAWKTWFGDSTVQTLLWMFVFSGAVAESGALKVFVNKMLSSKLVQGSPLRFLIIFYGIVYIAGLFLSQSALLILMYAVSNEVLKKLDIPEDSELPAFFKLGIAFASMTALILPFKGVHVSAIGIASSAMAQYGATFDNAAYMIAMFLTKTLWLVLYVLLMKFVFKVDFSPLMIKADTISIKKEEAKFSRKQAVLMGALVAFIVFIIITMFLPAKSAVVVYYNKFGLAWCCAAIVAFLCIFRDKEGGPYIKLGPVMKNSVIWVVLINTIIFSQLGSAINSNDLGIKAVIVAFFKPFMEGVGWPGLILIQSIISIVFTNLTNGSPITFLLNGAILPMVCATMPNINASVFTASILSCSSFAFLTPAAIAWAPILHSQPEITRKWIYKRGPVLMVIYIVMSALIMGICGYVL